MSEQAGTPEVAASNAVDRAPKAPKGGRNLPAAIGVGAGLGALLLLGLWVPPVLALTAAAASVLGVWEILTVLNERAGYGTPRWVASPLAFAFIPASYHFGLKGTAAALGISLVIIALATLCTGAKRTVGYFKSLGGSMMAMLWVPTLLGIGLAYFATERGWAGILLALLMAISNDTFGYIAGVNFGKHPLAPVISPKKSWEGLAGSFVGSAAVACTVIGLFGHPFWWGIPFAALMVIVATAGDLLESVFKRRMGIKDMSNLIPGHGGMMDRLDSIVWTVGVGCLIFSIWPL